MLSSDEDHWAKYNQAQAGRPVRPLLIQALSYSHSPGKGRALDLGAGAGIETAKLLSHGFEVHSVEPDAHSENLIQSTIMQADPDYLKHWSHSVATAQDFVFDEHSFDFIYSGFALPFCPPEHFPAAWSRILNAVAPGGILAVDLLGPRDSWAEQPLISTVERSWVEDSLQDFTVLHFDEKAHHGKTFTGEKFWHIFTLIAQR